MTPFKYHNGAYRAQWDPFELITFIDAAKSVMDALKGSETNPLRQRLLPPISKDVRVADEFRRLAGQQLVDAKLRNLTSFSELLNNAAQSTKTLTDEVEVVIPEPEAKAVLQALTAIRIWLGEVLGIRDDADSDILYHQLMEADSQDADADDPEESRSDSEGSSSGAADEEQERQVFLGSVFAAGGFAQDSLVGAMQAQMASSGGI